jgi:hypothetical protein
MQVSESGGGEGRGAYIKAWMIDDYPEELSGAKEAISSFAQDDEIEVSSSAQDAGEVAEQIRNGETPRPALIVVDMNLKKFNQPTFAAFSREDIQMPAQAQKRGLKLITGILLEEPAFRDCIIIGISGVTTYATEFKKLRDQGHRVAFFEKDTLERKEGRDKVMQELGQLGLDSEFACIPKIDMARFARIVSSVAKTLEVKEPELLTGLGLSRVPPGVEPPPQAVATLNLIFRLLFALDQMFGESRFRAVISGRGEIIAGKSLREAVLGGDEEALRRMKTEIERQLGGEI